MITAPFNFVPLSKKVFFPDWNNNGNEVSHDIPFEDSQSGVIDITLTAKSPIFVRDGGKNKEKFCNHNGTPYIPSSSVKGMIRSVLEIMSFSKMSQVDDNTYAVRDLSSAKNFYMKEMQKTTYCGWLKKTDDGYVIADCGEAERISHREIDKQFLNSDFSSFFMPSKFQANDSNQKTSEYKYNIIGGVYQKISVGDSYISKKNPKYDKRLFCRYDKKGREGTLVLTGQPTARKNTGKMGDGKGFEFVFFKSKEELDVSEKNMQDFLFAYFDKRTTEPKESEDWFFWKNKLENNGKVPVFFQKNGKGVAHFGLSFLYKLPYAYSVNDGIPTSHNDKRKDLAETIFGYIGKDEALKGRVQFSHFKATKNIEVLEERTEILGTPRASYYPIYVRQNSTDFKTFMDNDFSIAGRKRYPIHNSAEVVPTINTGNENVGTTFSPIKDGVVFQGKVRYHNLKKEELGALLSALTFHNTKGCFHNIGMAKSLGYGKIALKISGMDNIEEYLKSFELKVTEQVVGWSKTEQLKELLSMATEQANEENSELKYMILNPQNKIDQFSEHKVGFNKDYLKKYTALDNITTINLKSLILLEDLEYLELLQEELEQKEKERQEKMEQEEKLKQEEQERIQAIEREKEEKEKSFQTALNSDNTQILQNFIDKHSDHKKIDEIKSKKDEIELSKQSNKHQKADKLFKSAYKALEQNKGKKKDYQKKLDEFLNKWEKEKNNKDSLYILEKIKGLK